MAAKKKKKAKKKTGKKTRKASKKRRKKTVAQHHKSHISAAMSYNARAIEHIKAQELLARAKRRRGKRWLCAGPVRSGCGGSNSKVVR